MIYNLVNKSMKFLYKLWGPKISTINVFIAYIYIGLLVCNFISFL